MFAKAPIHDLAGYGIDGIDGGTMPTSCFPRFNRNGTFPKSCFPRFNKNGAFLKSFAPVFSRNGIFPKMCLTSCQWDSLHPDTQATWDSLSDMVKTIIFGLQKDPARCNLYNISAFDILQVDMHDFQLNCIEDTDNTPSDPDIDHGDAGVQVDGDLQVPVLCGEQPIFLQGILHELVDLNNLDRASTDDFELDSVCWMELVCSLIFCCLSLVPFPSIVCLEN